MKKFLVLLLTLGCMQFAYADNDPTANIKIKISGAVKDNRYFLCVPNIGCLSILAAQKGRIYPIYHPIEMDKMYVANLQNFRLHSQGLPSSCNVTVNTNQTITIYGKLITGSNNTVLVNNLRCSLN